MRRIYPLKSTSLPIGGRRHIQIGKVGSNGFVPPDSFHRQAGFTRRHSAALFNKYVVLFSLTPRPHDYLRVARYSVKSITRTPAWRPNCFSAYQSRFALLWQAGLSAVFGKSAVRKQQPVIPVPVSAEAKRHSRHNQFGELSFRPLFQTTW